MTILIMTTDATTIIGVKIDFDQFKEIIRDNFKDKYTYYKKQLKEYNEKSKCPECDHCRSQTYDYYDKDPEISVYRSFNWNGKIMTLPDSNYELIASYNYN